MKKKEKNNIRNMIKIEIYHFMKIKLIFESYFNTN